MGDLKGIGKLARATIYKLDVSGNKISVVDNESDEKYPPIEVCFNPKEYELQKGQSMYEGKAPKKVADEKDKPPAIAPQELGPQQGTVLSVNLQFDTYEEKVSVREKYVRRIEKLCENESKEKPHPPNIAFVWGKFRFVGLIESFSQKYTMFLSDGTPVRAECSIRIKQNDHYDMGDDDNLHAMAKKDSGSSYTVKQGDSLWLIAADQLGSADKWKKIADDSGLSGDKLLNLKAGDKLTIKK